MAKYVVIKPGSPVPVGEVVDLDEIPHYLVNKVKLADSGASFEVATPKPKPATKRRTKSASANKEE